MKNLSRRDFIKLAVNALFSVGGALGLAGLTRYFSYLSAPEQPTEFDLGNLSDFPLDSRVVREDIPAVIFNRGGQISAYSLICPHLGCAVESEDEGFACPCHGSRFDSNGAVAQGPAQKSLKKLRVEILEDNQAKLYLG